MAEVSRQRRALGLRILTGSVPAHWGPDGEGVYDLVQPDRRGASAPVPLVVDDIAERLRDCGVARRVPGAVGRACIMVSVTGTGRDLPNFDSQISSSSADQSMSAQGRDAFSPTLGRHDSKMRLSRYLPRWDRTNSYHDVGMRELGLAKFGGINFR